MREMLPLLQEDFILFQKLLIETCGLYFEEGRNQSLHLALWQRLQHRGYDSYREYYNLLKFHPEGRQELRELLDLITIGETYFFRNKAQFNVLMKSVLPEIIQRKVSSQKKSIRVWSAGCSRGDEPYSIAIAMMEVIPSYHEWDISILGTDINRNGLAYAKEAHYEEKDIRYLPKEYLEKYFKIQGSTYTLLPDVRRWVQYEYHNLVQDSFFHEKMQNIDLVFCRNVTIYFDFPTTRRVIENFYNCLTEEGYLFIGHTETLWQITNKFERIEFPQTFIYRKGASLVREDARKPFMAVPEVNLEDLTHLMALKRPSGSILSESLPSEGRVGGLTSVQELVTEKSLFPKEQKSDQREKTKRLEPIETPLDQISFSSPNHLVAQDREQILTSLTDATTLANEAKYKEAADILTKVIEEDNLSVEAYYLLGVLSYKSGNLKKAESQFRKVIYADPDSVLAYFNLGNIYLYQRKYSGAAREFRNAIRLLEKRPKNEQIRFCEDFTVEFLLNACRNNLSEISKRGE
jgi:chemotaxis protein methyltransferase CheR